MNIGFEYIKYRWNAKGRHGIHSPFVYDLLDKCLKIKLADADKKSLEALFSKLEQNKSSIEIADFGAGSKKLTHTRSIQSIFKTSSSKGKYGRLLYQLARFYSPKTILEFGTSLGVGTAYLQLGNPAAAITTIEVCENTRKKALENFKTLGLEEIVSQQMTFDAYLKTLPASASFDLIFVDGHHDGEALLNYMKQLRSFAHDETIFILDDIRWSTSMLHAWNEIVEDKNYHVTLDFFRFGIVVPRKHQVKEHFTLKFA